MQFLIDNRTRINTTDKYKRTPLLIAARNGLTNIVSLCLQRGSDVNYADSSGNTALQNACAYGHMEVIKLLLTNGADPTL